MNQEQNNFNQSLNTYGQSKNNTTMHQQLNDNQQNISSNLNAQKINTAKKKTSKKNIVSLIIGIIAIVLIIAGIFVGRHYITKEKEDINNNGQSNSNQQNSAISKDIIEMYIDFDSVIALTKDGQLYGIGAVDGLGKDIEKTQKIVMFANNVKEFSVKNGTFYLDRNNNLYTAGWSYQGGSLDNFEKIYEKVVTYDHGFCVSIVTENKDLYIDGGLSNGTNCGLNRKTDGFEFAATNVKTPIMGFNYNGYIDINDNLFIQTDGGEYKQLLSGVVEVIRGIFTPYYLTEKNEVYSFNYIDNDMRNPLELQLIMSDVIEFGNGYYKKTDNKYYIEYRDGDEVLEFSQDIKKIYYVRGDKLIYLNNEDKIVLYQKNKNSKIIDNVINSMKDIYNFIS